MKIFDGDQDTTCSTNLMLWDLPIKQIATLLECKDYIARNVEKGLDCPCCTRYMKLYKRAYASSMAIFLIGLYKYSMTNGDGFHYYRDVFKSMGVAVPGDYTKNVLWGLVEMLSEDKEKLEEEGKKSSGYYKITKMGIDFVCSRLEIPKQVFLLLNNIEGFSEEKVNIETALGKNFDYYELMQ